MKSAHKSLVSVPVFQLLDPLPHHPQRRAFVLPSVILSAASAGGLVSGGYACVSAISSAAMFAPFPAGPIWKICSVVALSSLCALDLMQPFLGPSSSLRLWLSGVYVLIKLTHSGEHFRGISFCFYGLGFLQMLRFLVFFCLPCLFHLRKSCFCSLLFGRVVLACWIINIVQPYLGSCSFQNGSLYQWVSTAFRVGQPFSWGHLNPLEKQIYDTSSKIYVTTVAKLVIKQKWK